MGIPFEVVPVNRESRHYVIIRKSDGIVVGVFEALGPSSAYQWFSSRSDLGGNREDYEVRLATSEEIVEMFDNPDTQ